MRSRWFTWPVIAASVMLLGVPARAGASGIGWTLSSPVAVGSQSQFNATAALSASDAWAVGTSGFPDFNSASLVEHWNGSQWSVTRSPNPPGAAFTNLLAVSGDAPNDVWAVGRWAAAGELAPRPLALHWNGAVWRVVQTPSLPDGAGFQAVSARARDDVWAVGDTGLDNLIEHWDGHRWSVVPSPNEQTGGDLQAVTALSGTDAWAMGSFLDATFRTHSLVLHWDGQAWSITSSPETGAFSALTAVSALSPNDVWAVGHTFPSNVATLTEHWDGNSWTVVPGPDVPVSQFNGVAATSPSSVWAVGSAVGADGQLQTLAEQWTGTQWAVSATPDAGAISNLLAVTATPGGILAVGARQPVEADTPIPLAESNQP